MKKNKVISIALASILSCSIMGTVVNAEFIEDTSYVHPAVPDAIVAISDKTNECLKLLENKGWNIDAYVIELSCNDVDLKLLSEIKTEEEFLFIKGLLNFRYNLRFDYNNIFDTQSYYNTKIGVEDKKYNTGIKGMFALWGIPLNHDMYEIKGNLRLPMGIEATGGSVKNEGDNWLLTCQGNDKVYSLIESHGEFYIDNIRICNYKEDKIDVDDFITAILNVMSEDTNAWSIGKDSSTNYYRLFLDNDELFISKIREELGVTFATNGKTVNLWSYSTNDNDAVNANFMCSILDENYKASFIVDYTENYHWYKDVDRNIEVGGSTYNAMHKDIRGTFCDYKIVDYLYEQDAFFDGTYKYKTIKVDNKYYVIEGTNVLEITPSDYNTSEDHNSILIPKAEKTYETISDYLKGENIKLSDVKSEATSSELNEEQVENIINFTNYDTSYYSDFDFVFNMLDIFNLNQHKSYDLAFSGILGGKSLLGNVLQFNEGSCLLLNKTPFLFSKDSNVYGVKKKFLTNVVKKINSAFDNLDITQNDVKYDKDADMYICTNSEFVSKFLESMNIKQKTGYKYALEFFMNTDEKNNSNERGIRIQEYKDISVKDLIKSGKFSSMFDYDGEIKRLYSNVKYDNKSVTYTKLYDFYDFSEVDASIDIDLPEVQERKESYDIPVIIEPVGPADKASDCDLEKLEGTIALGTNIYDVHWNIQDLKSQLNVNYANITENEYVYYNTYNNLKTCKYIKDGKGIYIESIYSGDMDSLVASNVYAFNYNAWDYLSLSTLNFYSNGNSPTYNRANTIKVLEINKKGNTYNYISNIDSLKGSITVEPVNIERKEIRLPKQYKTYNLSIEDILFNVVNDKVDTIDILMSKVPEDDKAYFSTKIITDISHTLEVPAPILNTSENIPEALKPVIYLYPDKDNTEVTVNLDYAGEFTAVYPEFTNNTEWTVTANKDSSIVLNNREYNYLYWEGNHESGKPYVIKSGTCVAKEDTVKFLEEKLAQLGLTEKEQDDFISFWLPKLNQNAYNVISFDTEKYESIAHLNVVPNPDKIIRVFMTYQGTDKFVDIPEEVIDVDITRNGFTVIEWGGGAGVIAPEYLS